jgi:hypothetical protein
MGRLICKASGTTLAFPISKMKWKCSMGSFSNEYLSASKSISADDEFLLRSEVMKLSPGGYNCFHAAVFFDCPALISLFVIRGGNVNDADKSGWTPLHEAASRGHTECAIELLKYDAKINKNALLKNHESTPLLVSIEWGGTEMVQYLLSHNADPSILDERWFRETAAHFAARVRDDGTPIRMLLDKKPRLVYARNVLGKTPLHEAAERGNVEAIKALIDFGADLNAQDKDKYTALHSIWCQLQAFYSSQYEIPDEVDNRLYGCYWKCRQLVIQNGANLQLRDRYGFTPAEDAFGNYLMAPRKHPFSFRKRKAGTALHSWEGAPTSCRSVWSTQKYISFGG